MASDAAEPGRILVVDDDPDIARLVGRVLQAAGHRTRVVHSGPEALAAIDAEPVDLVITDMAMPGMTGLQLLEEIRRRKVACELVVLTAVGTVPLAVEAMKSGASEFLEKPVDFARLRRVAREAVGRRRAAPVPVSEAAVVDEIALSSLLLNVEAATGEARPAEHPAPPPPLPRRREDDAALAIARYEVRGLLGRGGMGEVFRCRDPLIGRDVAVKVLRALPGQPKMEAEMLARFQREAAAAGVLNHPGIVGVYDLGRDPALGLWYIVLELVHGVPLDRRIAESAGLPIPEAVRTGFQIADALAYAHARGIVHRDVKPSNVLVRPDGTSKLLDFGLAGFWNSDLTVTGRLFGSPSYMSPERVRGDRGGTSSDQFSLGVVLHEMLTGTNPFAGDSPEARIRRVLDVHPPPLQRDGRPIPEPLNRIVLRAIAKQEDARFPTMEVVVRELAAAGAALGLPLERYEPRAS
jgi:serine/threonine-protein kinase